MVITGLGGMVMGEREVAQLYQQLRPRRVHPNLIPAITLNSTSGILAMACGAKGPNLIISTACSSSAHALGQALNCLREVETKVLASDIRIFPRNETAMENPARYIIRASFSQERMQYLAEPSKVVNRAKDGSEEKVFDALDRLGARCAHIPDRGEQITQKSKHANPEKTI